MKINFEFKKDRQTFAVVLVVILLLGGAYYLGQRSGGSALGGGAGQMNRQLRSGARTPGGFIMGEVVSRVDSNLTLKLRDGGSRVIIIASSTEVMKQAKGTLEEITQGLPVTINGVSNADGSFTAQSIQVRPEAGGRPGGY